MNFIEGHEVQCDYCKELFLFEDARDLEIAIKDGIVAHYLPCPKCGQKIWSNGIVVIKIGPKSKREPRSEFEANLEASIQFDQEFDTTFDKLDKCPE